MKYRIIKRTPNFKLNEEIEVIEKSELFYKMEKLKKKKRCLIIS